VSYRNIRLSLAGEYQVRNAALAVAAVEALGDLPALPADVKRALGNTRWPGRLDEYRAARRTLLEGAHNPEGALKLRDYLLKRNVKELHLVFGAVRDKDIAGMAAFLFPLAKSIHLAPLHNSRSASAQEIAELNSRWKERMSFHTDSLEALPTAWRQCPRNGLVVVTGSLYLLGEVLPEVRKSAAKYIGALRGSGKTRMNTE
jgi:dihydrofolate synthase / folylpolyglutamate synthase